MSRGSKRRPHEGVRGVLVGGIDKFNIQTTKGAVGAFGVGWDGILALVWRRQWSYVAQAAAAVKLAIPAIVFGAVGTAGQRCTSTRRSSVSPPTARASASM